MRRRSIVNNKNPRRGGEGCIRYADGTVSADALVEEMLAGVDVYDFEMDPKAQLIKNGVPKEIMDRLIPEK
jgi:hypothetical protein